MYKGVSVPKFKVGDEVQHRNTSIYIYKILKVDTLNNMYDSEVVRLSSKSTFPHPLPTRLFHDNIPWMDSEYELVNQTGPNKPLFTYGDKITLHHERNFLIEIDGMDYINNSYKLHYLATPKDKTHMIGCKIWFPFDQIHREGELVTAAVLNVIDTKAIIQKECTCSSQDLFIKGCRCGAVKPYKLKMS